MASGSWTFGTRNSYIQGLVNWSSSSNGSSANSSNISVAVYFRRTNSGYTSYGKVNTYVDLVGWGQKSELNYYVSMSNPNTWTLVFAKNWTVSHASDGKRTIRIHVAGNGNFSIGSFDTYKDVNLDTIPRYTSIKTWSVAEVGKTYAKINWGTADTVDWVRVYLNDSSQWTDNPGSVNGTSGSFVYTGAASSGASIPSVSTLKPGTTYKLKCWVRRKDSQLPTTSGNISFTTNPVATISNLDSEDEFSYNIGDDITLKFDNSSANKSWLSFSLETANGQYEELFKTDEAIQSDSYIWKLSSYSSILYSKMSTKNSASCKIKCGTTIVENGQTINYVSGEFYGRIYVKNSNPIFSDFDYADENTSIQKILGDTHSMLQYYSNMVIRIPLSKKATAQNGASIVKYIVKVDDSQNVTYELNYKTDSEVVLELGKYYSSGTKKINICALDSRGNTSNVIVKSFNVISYHPPFIEDMNLNRLNGYEAEVVLDFYGGISKVIIGNVEKNTSRKVLYRYAEVGTAFPSSYTEINGVKISSFSSNEYEIDFSQNTKDDTFGITGSGSSKLILDNNKSYNFQFRISDSFINNDYDMMLEKGSPIAFIGDNGQFSVGMVPDITRNDIFQVNGDIMGVDIDGNKVSIVNTLKNLIVTTKPGEAEPTDQPAGGYWIEYLD